MSTKYVTLSLVAVLTTAILVAEHLLPVPSMIATARFEFNAKTYAVELVPGQRAKVTEGREYCANDGEAPELEGDCALALKSGPEELSRLALKDCHFVSSKGRWLARSGDDDPSSPQPVLKLFQRAGKEPLMYVSQYAGCNGNIYHFYWIASQAEPPVLRPVTFVGDSLAAAMVASPPESVRNQLYAAFDEPYAVRLLRQPADAKDRLLIAGYNNARPGHYVDQFVEDVPGVWRFIRETTK